MYLAIPGVVVLFVLVMARVSGILRYIPNSRIGLVEKLWSRTGSLKTGLIALNGEAGFQADVLRGGFHCFFPFQYRVRQAKLVTIPQGRIGYVFARDGLPLAPSQTLASNATATNFQDVREFLASGGQKGPQRMVLREGTYALNLAVFAVLTEDETFALEMDPAEAQMFAQMSKLIADRNGYSAIVIRDADDKIGVVTVHDGPSLPDGEIIAPTVGVTKDDDTTFHNNFQNSEAFLAAGGCRGRQLQVLVEGSYYINRLFATIEIVPKTIIDVGSVGVVVSYTGKLGNDVSGQDYKHGELVPVGCRGVWETPLMPGKYAFNPFAGSVLRVPTTNFMLKWEQQTVGNHKFDENLKEVSLITKDAFEPNLPLSVVVHISYREAPLVVQRFGDIKRLVEQTLDPMVAAYFKNVGQSRTLIELLQERSDIQQQSSDEMKAKFRNYNLELVEVLIGTPRSGDGPQGKGIEMILEQLRERQIAVEQVSTYKLQETAATQERSLRETEARAKQQTSITESELSITIRTNEGLAAKALAEQEAATMVITARATAEKLQTEGAGQAASIRAVGEAEAAATKAQVDAYGGPEYQLNATVMTRLAQAIENGKIPLVPQIQILGGAQGSDNGPLTGLTSLLLADKTLNLVKKPPQDTSANDAGEAAA